MAESPAVRHEHLHHEYFFRYMWDIFGQISRSSGNTRVNRVYLIPLQVYRTVTIDRIGIVRNTTAPGVVKMIMGIYADNGGTPVGGALLGNTLAAGTAIGAISQKTEVALTASLQLTPGLYWAAMVFDTGPATYCFGATGWVYTGTIASHRYDAGAFVLLNPCPATTTPSDDGLVGSIFLRVASCP